LQLNVHEIHLHLAHKLDKQKLKASIMKRNNDKNIQL